MIFYKISIKFILIKFFLECVIETAKNARIKFESVVNFTNEMNEVILKLPVKAKMQKRL